VFPLIDDVPRRHPPVVTWLLISANAAVFALELSLPPEKRESLFYMMGIVPRRYAHPEWAEWVGLPVHDYWPFLTSMFLHGGWLHVLSNMWVLWIFGDNVEDRMGPLRFLIFYLLCGVAAGLVHFFTDRQSEVPAVGASGAIAGVMGAYFVMFPFARVIVVLPILFYPLFFELPAVVFLAIWFLTQLFSGTLALAAPDEFRGIAWWAHIGGFVTGILAFGPFLRDPAHATRPRPRHRRLV
jgi:membrane associated rhomboid family serine protease